MANCGKCGYQVRGISTMSCPECGADLREVGIIKSKSSNKTIWIVMGLLIVVGMFVMCLVSAMYFWMAAPSAATMPIGPPPPPARTQGTSKPIDLVDPPELEGSDVPPDSRDPGDAPYR